MTGKRQTYDFSSMMTITDIQYRITPRMHKASSGCILWGGKPRADGYGRTSFKGRELKAHRLIASLAFGAIPKEKVIDHLCRNRLCVNPRHLEAVTNRVNLQRSHLVGRHRKNSLLTAGSFCKSGKHHLSEDTIARRKNGRGATVNRCKPCQYDRDKEWRQRKRLALANAV